MLTAQRSIEKSLVEAVSRMELKCLNNVSSMATWEETGPSGVERELIEFLHAQNFANE